MSLDISSPYPLCPTSCCYCLNNRFFTVWKSLFFSCSHQLVIFCILTLQYSNSTLGPASAGSFLVSLSSFNKLEMIVSHWLNFLSKKCSFSISWPWTLSLCCSSGSSWNNSCPGAMDWMESWTSLANFLT